MSTDMADDPRTAAHDDQPDTPDTSTPLAPGPGGTQHPPVPGEGGTQHPPVPGEGGRKRSWEPDFVPPPPRTGPPRWVGITLGFAIAAAGAGIYVNVADPWGMKSMTCERLGSEAVRVARFSDTDKRLVEVTESRLVSDERETYEPPTGDKTGGERAVVLTCAATGSFDNDTTADITLTLEVDQREKLLVFYVPTPGGQASSGA